MTEFRYRAFISYSHKDEAWASWLHKSLETYRLPRNLVGSSAGKGLPASRIRPVFRDRDDLSSSGDLGGRVKQALADSENLIVICSPNAASSRWVNDEIRYFAGLGRLDRIFCIVVGGEISDPKSETMCFPPALAEVGIQEPLAADARKWADGKKLAKLKLIAGLLDIRLDALRQRDLQRRRKRQLVTWLGVVVAIGLIVATAISQISEQHEREKAEQMAGFIVDLGERLQSDADLETLNLISTEALKHLQSLDLDKLSAGTGEKVALALRQMGNVSQGQGRLDEALDAFERSRDIFLSLTKKHPQLPGMLFQLGNAEFYIGNLYSERAQYENALMAMERYQSLTRQLYDRDPDNPDWIMELSYSHNNLAALRLGRGLSIDEATLAHIAEAVRLMEKVVELKPGSKLVVDSYTTTLAWAADAHAQICNLQEAMEVRQKVTALARSSVQTDPGNNDLNRRYAYALSGGAKLQTQLGQLDAAEEDLTESVSILRQLSLADPSNVVIRGQVVYRMILLANLLSDIGKYAKAQAIIQQLMPETEAGGVFSSQEVWAMRGHVDLLVLLAEVESGSGDQRQANIHLHEAMQLHLSKIRMTDFDKFDRLQLQIMRYQWWLGNGQDGLELFSPPVDSAQLNNSEHQSCTESDFEARMYLIQGQKARAGELVNYLRNKKYAAPAFIKFCYKYELCTQES